MYRSSYRKYQARCTRLVGTSKAIAILCLRALTGDEVSPDPRKMAGQKPGFIKAWIVRQFYKAGRRDSRSRALDSRDVTRWTFELCIWFRINCRLGKSRPNSFRWALGTSSSPPWLYAKEWTISATWPDTSFFHSLKSTLLLLIHLLERNTALRRCFRR